MIQTQAPLHDKNALKMWLEQRMPGHKVIVRGPIVIVGTGAATGVLIKPGGPGYVSKMPWAFPNIGVQLLITLTIFAGILPGLLVFLFTWLAVKGGLDRLRANLTQVLQTGQVLGGGMTPALGHPQPAVAGAYGQAGYDPSQQYPQQGPGGYPQGGGYPPGGYQG